MAFGRFQTAKSSVPSGFSPFQAGFERYFVTKIGKKHKKEAAFSDGLDHYQTLCGLLPGDHIDTQRLAGDAHREGCERK